MGTCQSSIPHPSAVAVSNPTKDTNHTQLGDDHSSTTFSASGAAATAAAATAAAEIRQETTHPILKQIESLQKDTVGRPFGRILDAGTGLGSFHWLAHLLSQPEQFGVQPDTWIAVTASPVMAKEILKEAQHYGITNMKDHLVLGNWFDGTSHQSEEGSDGQQEEPRALLLEGEMFDTILVDYLIGAMDAFSPYLQDCILDRLVQHLNPGGHLYLIGTEPLPNKDTKDPHKDLVCRVKQLRDACILLTGDRCYREYPLSWTLRQMQRCGLSIDHMAKYPLLHRRQDLHDQLGVGRSMLKKIPDRDLASSMETALDQLELECHRKLGVKRNQHHHHQQQQATATEPSIHLGYDYLVVAQKLP